MEKIAIIGAHGFLGQALSQKLPQALQVGRKDIDHYLNSRPPVDVLLCAAAYIPYGHMNEFSVALLDSNVDLVLRLSKAFPRARLVHASSVAVYGKAEGLRTEKSPFLEPNAYGLAKLAGECITQCHDSHAIIRFPSLYGPKMNENTFIPKVISAAKKDKKITLYGDGSRKQNYLQIEDAADAMIVAAKSQVNGVFLGTHPQEYSNQEVAEIVAKATGATIEFDHEDLSPSFHYDASWTYESLGWKPKKNFSHEVHRLAGPGD